MPETTATPTATPGEGVNPAIAAGEGEGNLGFESKGAFLSAMGLPDRDNRESPDGKEGKDPEKARETPTTPATGDFIYEFAGKQYHGATEAEAKSKAEHAYKVQQGQSKAAQQRETQLRRELAQLQQRAKSSPAPTAPATQTQPDVKGATPPKPSTSEGSGEDGNLLGLTDAEWVRVQEMRKNGEHDKADIFLLVKYEDALKKYQQGTKAEIAAAKAALAAELDAIRKPAQEREQQQQLLSTATDSLRNRAELLADDGELVYPEMQNDGDLAEIVDTWERMCSPVGDYPALPPEIATHPAGFHLAYAVWFHETWGDFVRWAQSEGYAPKSAAPGAASPEPPKKVSGPAPGRLSAPVAMPGSAPRRDPITPVSPADQFKKALVSHEDNLI